MRVTVSVCAVLLLVLLFGATVTSCSKASLDPSAESASAYQPIDSQVTGIARGGLVYRQYGCHLCHGANATNGLKNANAEGGEILALNRVAEGFRKSELKRKILEGTRYVPRANTNGPVPPYRMPAFHDNMSAENVDALITYLFSLMPQSEADDDW